MPYNGSSYTIGRIVLLAVWLSGLLLPPSNTQAETPADSAIRWFTDFDVARAEAAASGKPILMSFSGSDWCLPCMRLKKDLFTTEGFLDLADGNFVLLQLDFPARKKNKLPSSMVAHHEALAERYNQRGSFPLVLIVDAAGNVLGQMTHPLASTDAYLESLRRFVQP